MRIALDGIPLLTCKTGIGKYTFELAKALKGLQEAPEVRLLYGVHCIRRFRRTDQPDCLTTGRNALDINIFRRLRNAVKNWVKKQAADFEFAIFRPDLFHATNYVADSYKAPLVVTVHDLSFLRYPEAHPPERLKWLEEGLPSTLNHARRIIADSQFTKDELISLLGVPGNRINVVHLGVTANYRPRDKDMLAEKLREFDLAPKGYILSVGTLEPRKNISKL
ncbi:MAG: glycosyltransferase, partial [Desulfobacteraceae bacterium]|nr:glycosyltransferase [Desulfobacteraceae bacterium]